MKWNLVSRTVGSVLILRQTAEPPSDAEWDDALKLLRSLLREHGSDVRAIVHTDGGHPNEAQREALKKTLAKGPVPTAVVSDDARARMTSSSVALLNRMHRSFAVNELPEAYVYLRLTVGEIRELEAAWKQMGSLLR